MRANRDDWRWLQRVCENAGRCSAPLRAFAEGGADGSQGAA